MTCLLLGVPGASSKKKDRISRYNFYNANEKARRAITRRSVGADTLGIMVGSVK